MILDPNPNPFPAPWAVACGEDRFGLWQAFEIEGVRQVMRWIEPGEFLMGSPRDEPERRANEAEHSVLLTSGFWLAESTCTQEMWEAIIGSNPSQFVGDDQRPVDQVSWWDSLAFFGSVESLTRSVIKLRFPTEAEWEYACRAGSRSAFWWGSGLQCQDGNYDCERPYNGAVVSESLRSTQKVLAYSPNQFGLFQMHGNVWEWCGDWLGDHEKDSCTDPKGPVNGEKRVLRGGSWLDDGSFLRSACRSSSPPDDRDIRIGFRFAID